MHTNILLYEEWGDESYYNSEHMNTVHLKEFIANSRNFLAGPQKFLFGMLIVFLYNYTICQQHV